MQESNIQAAQFEPPQSEVVHAQARFLSVPVRVTKAAPRGLHKLKLGTRRDGFLYVPSGYEVDRPAPLVVMLHGAGGNGQQGLRVLQRLADRHGFLLLAPDSRGQTWDIILGEYGPDVAFIDRALAHTFSRYAVDRKRVAVGGFSDGASYALSLGLTNGSLFSHVIAFSPGFMAPTAQQGAPYLFISHGTGDRVLPVDRCSRKLVPILKQARYQLRYREFEGGHTVPAEISLEAVQWFTGKL